MELYDYMKFVAALIFVLGLIGVLALIAKKTGLGVQGAMSPSKRRLKIIEILHIDARRKAVLLSRDDIEHLVILGPTGETLIESNIQAKNVHDQKQA